MEKCTGEAEAGKQDKFLGKRKRKRVREGNRRVEKRIEDEKKRMKDVLRRVRRG